MDKHIEGMWRGYFGDVWASLEGAWPEGALGGNGALGGGSGQVIDIGGVIGDWRGFFRQGHAQVGFRRVF